ncbi:DUF3575 domain-containing protein [Paraflavitalea soli]|uniref:DUF3575 domain-containing protein n=1 Tax=Paraflavitalea soli TaxID=2315862 RepID=A0A3B7MML8_9BACT|nr:DUF3575 domain-containing protein [Paraflavitalea soli]AXY74977.1 DUF3575 domain-containing protein [Paraflavitalea soli]
MRSKLSFTILLLLSSLLCFSQDAEVTDITNITKVTILSPGIGYEKRIAKYQSLYLQGFLDISGGVGYSSSLGFLSFLYLDPTFSLEYRYYYNFRRRQERGKRVAMNSLNYIAPFFRSSFPRRNYINSSGEFERKRRAIYATGATFGLQRNFRSRFSLDMNIGLGYMIEGRYTDDEGIASYNNNQFYFPGRISFGIWLNKRK